MRHLVIVNNTVALFQKNDKKKKPPSKVRPWTKPNSNGFPSNESQGKRKLERTPQQTRPLQASNSMKSLLKSVEKKLQYAPTTSTSKQSPVKKSMFRCSPVKSPLCRPAEKRFKPSCVLFGKNKAQNRNRRLCILRLNHHCFTQHYNPRLRNDSSPSDLYLEHR